MGRKQGKSNSLMSGFCSNKRNAKIAWGGGGPYIPSLYPGSLESPQTTSHDLCTSEILWEAGSWPGSYTDVRSVPRYRRSTEAEGQRGDQLTQPSGAGGWGQMKEDLSKFYLPHRTRVFIFVLRFTSPVHSYDVRTPLWKVALYTNTCH